jgi:cold-inducible RNA-binding protein
MSKRIYVGNLSYNTTEESLMEAFGAWEPASVALAMDDGDRPRGFGFLEIPEDDQATLAIAAMNGKELDGRVLTVYEARPRAERGGVAGDRPPSRLPDWRSESSFWGYNRAMEPTKRGRGRPPGVRYPRTLPVYDTEEGMAVLHALADQRGISAAAVVRQLVREEARRVGLTAPSNPERAREGTGAKETASEDTS